MPLHEVLQSPSTSMSWCDHLSSHCSSDTSRFVADYFSINAEINWIEAFEIHSNEFVFSDSWVVTEVQCFAGSLLTGAGTNPGSSGLWGQHRVRFWDLVPRFWDGSINSSLLVLLKHQQWQHWHFNSHGGFGDNSCARNDDFRFPAAARKMQLSFLALMEQSLGRETL